MGTVNTQELLAERQKTHGEYGEHARCTQSILRVLQAERGYPMLSDTQKETLHMIAHKMGRIVTGNPDVEDHWDDIAGYAVLISQRLRQPIPLFDQPNDIAGALAMAWNCTRAEAVQRHAKLIQVLRDKRSATMPNNTEDQRKFDEEVEKAAAAAMAAETITEEPIPQFLTRKEPESTT